MARGVRSMFGASLCETEVFRTQMYCIEKSTSDIVGTFRRPHSDFVLGELCPSWSPRYALDWSTKSRSIWLQWPQSLMQYITAKHVTISFYSLKSLLRHTLGPTIPHLTTLLFGRKRFAWRL